MIRGEFSASSRVQTFLTVVSSSHVSVRHVSGFSNVISDFASRNAPQCLAVNCQICSFNLAAEDCSVMNVTSGDIINGSIPVPFTSRAAWRDIQANCPSITRAKEHIKEGLKTSKKIPEYLTPSDTYVCLLSPEMVF